MGGRINVYLPGDLRERMDAATDEFDINWSQVAATAFELKLAGIAGRKTKLDMTDTIRRLRASKLQSEEDIYQRGHEAGQDWARRLAEWAELERLAKLGHDWFAPQGVVGEDAFGVSGNLLMHMNPDEYLGNRGAQEMFWQEATGDDEEPYPDRDFVHGFVDGAVEVYEQVKDELE